MSDQLPDPLPKDFTTEAAEMAYVLIEDPEDTHVIFIGTHDDLNLYQIWYNRNNPGAQFRVLDSFVPVVRRIPDGNVYVAKSGCRI